MSSTTKGNAALALGIIGTALGSLASAGGLSALLGISADPQDKAITRHDMELYQQINSKDTQIAQLQSQGYTDRAIGAVQQQISQQSVWNATATANLQCLQGQVAQLQGMTQLVIPNASVSPGWGPIYGPIPDTAETAVSLKSASAS